MTNYKITSEMHPTTGLVDYIAYGLIERNDEMIPCRIGFTEWNDDEDPEATHIFIDDGITSNGNHYYKETIKL